MSFKSSYLKKTFLLFSPYILKNRHSKMRLLIAGFLILVDISTASVIPYLSKQVVDSLPNPLASGILILVLLLGFFWILEKTLAHIQDILFFPVVNTTIRELTRDVVKHIHQIGIPDYQTLSIPEIMNCIRRISISARAFIKVFFLLILPTVVKLIITTIVITKLGMFGITLLPALLLAGVILYKGSQWYVSAREAAWQISDKMTLRVNDSLLNTKIARFFYDFEMQQVNGILEQEASLWYKTNTRLHTIHVLIGLALGLGITGILFGAVVAIQNKTLGVGDFVLIKAQLLAAFLPLKTLSVEFRQLVESTIDIKKIMLVLEIPKTNTKLNVNTQTTKASKSKENAILSLEHITFCHLPNQAIFSNLNLQLEAGQKVAITGASGSGKSSLLSLMALLHKPDAGSVYLKGKIINHFSPHQLAQTIHYIPQDLRLFNLSLRDNITYGSSDTANISDDKILKAAAAVGLLPLIQQLPEGLNAMVGEMGANLSGGEKQRVALARALLINPEILLLDETTHSLDVDCEKQALETLFSYIPTVIIASHKASTLEHVDRIIKIASGNLLEEEKTITLRKAKERGFILESASPLPA